MKNNQTKDQEKMLKDEIEVKKKSKKTYGKLLILLIVSVIIIYYYIYVFEIMCKNITPSNTFLICSLILVFNIFIFMVLWSFYMTFNTNPGIIPLYWGFYIGDDDFKRKRYCLICNAFKPERSHHCSTCNICVLNMDHHCPWVDNCIGFYNRKYFMILLFYTSLLTIYCDISLLYFIIQIIKDLIHFKIPLKSIIYNVFITGAYCFIAGFSYVITNFYKFHLNLVLNNTTTIESLDKEHESEYQKYCLSKYKNWVQVFGPSIIFWFVPIDCESGRPVGDGLTWETADNINMQKELVSKNGSSVKAKSNNNPSSNFGDNNYLSNNFNSTSPLS